LDELKEVQHLARLRETASHGRVLRAQIILTAYEHPAWNNAQIARKLGTTVGTVQKWRKRWGETRSLAEAQRSGAPRLFSLQRQSPDDRARLYGAPRVRAAFIPLVQH
jgi:transposase-like protein